MLVLALRMGMRCTRGCASLGGHWLLAGASAGLDTQWRVFRGMATGPAHHLADARCGLVACPLRHTIWLIMFGVMGSGRVQTAVLHAKACNTQRCAHGVGIRLRSPLLGGAGREVACACCTACTRRCGSHKCRADAILALLVS